jgi:hypothetical protein
MTGNAPVGPPWSVDLLADLHAGVLDPAQAAGLWPRVRADAAAMTVLAALDATRADLASLPPVTIPPQLAARLDAALAAEAAARPLPGVAPVLDLAAARHRRNRALGWGAGVLTAAAAAVAGVVMVAAPGTQSGDGVAAPAPATTTAALTVERASLGASARDTVGVFDYGPLGNPQECLAANGIDPATKPAGVRPVSLEGRSGVLFVLPTGRIAQFRLLVVGEKCGTGNPDTIASLTFGGITTTR